MQAIEELNIKSKYWKDLLTDEPFSRKDIIHLQDPMNLAGRNMQQFDHVKRNLKLISDEEETKLRVRLLESVPHYPPCHDTGFLNWGSIRRYELLLLIYTAFTDS